TSLRGAKRRGNLNGKGNGKDCFGPAIAMTKERERHCEERSDAAILMGKAMAEIASGQPSQ
ncbi:MAG: hypothetical protein LUF87_03330, partial [Alistipes sp.]|nr:hypothetical protein [Alistipes sp.]